MTGVAADALGPASADERFGARQLRSDRRGSDAAGEGQVLFVLGGDGWTDFGPRMCSPSFVREVGTIKVSAENARAAGIVMPKTMAETEEYQVLIMPGDRGRGQQAGGAVTRMSAADGAEGSFGSVHEVAARAAVNVHVHVAGDEITALQVDDSVSGCVPRWS